MLNSGRAMNELHRDIIDVDIHRDGGSCSGSGCSTKNAIRSSEEKNQDDAAPLEETHHPSQYMPGGKRLGQTTTNVSIVDLGACSDSDIASSPSSSASSGIPSPWRAKSSQPDCDSDFPPSFIHTNSPETTKGLVMKPARTVEPAKKKCLTNDSISIAKENKQPKGAKPTKARRRKGQRGSKKKGAPSATNGSIRRDSSASSAVANTNTKTKSAGVNTTKHFHCYLLRSLDPDHPLKTYIGFTTDPQRRIRQHNGILKNAGARRTKRAGRPWTFVCIVHGFQDKITALQFEWAWQHPDKSLAFREAVGGDQPAGKMKRRYGPKARLDELRVLVKECLPFCLYSLTIYFPEREYHNIYRGILRRGKDGNPYKKNDDESEAYEPLTDFKLCSLEDMPVAKEAAALKKKKIAKREAKKTEGKNESSVVETVNYASDVSELLDNHCQFDLNEDDDDNDECDRYADSESRYSNLKAIVEDGDLSSIDVCENGSDTDKDGGKFAAAMKLKEKNTFPSGKSSESHHGHKDMDDISKDFISLSIDVSQVKHAVTGATETCDFSTISSAESTSQCSIGKHDKKEYHQLPTDKLGKDTTAKMCDIVDLCDSP